MSKYDPGLAVFPSVFFLVRILPHHKVTRLISPVSLITVVSTFSLSTVRFFTHRRELLVGCQLRFSPLTAYTFLFLYFFWRRGEGFCKNFGCLFVFGPVCCCVSQFQLSYCPLFFPAYEKHDSVLCIQHRPFLSSICV